MKNEKLPQIKHKWLYRTKDLEVDLHIYPHPHPKGGDRYVEICARGRITRVFEDGTVVVESKN